MADAHPEPVEPAARLPAGGDGDTRTAGRVLPGASGV